MEATSVRQHVRQSLHVVVAAVLLVFGFAGCDKSKGGGGGGSESKTASSPSEEKPEKSAEANKSGAEKQAGDTGVMGGALPPGPQLTDEEIEKFAEVRVRMAEYQDSLEKPSGDGQKAKMRRVMRLKKKMEEILEDVGMSKAQFSSVAKWVDRHAKAKKKVEAKIREKRESSGSDEADAG